MTAELIQYRIGRAFDVDDIILNTTGSIIGFALYSGISGIASKLPKFLQNNIFYNILAVLVLIGIILLLSIALFGTGWF